MGSLSWMISFGILVTAWSLEENFTVRNTPVVDHTLDYKKKSYTSIGSYIGVDYWCSLECSWGGDHRLHDTSYPCVKYFVIHGSKKNQRGIPSNVRERLV